MYYRYTLDKPLPLALTTKPTICGWCSNLLKSVRNVYKGVNCERHYCSLRCHQLGEDRAIRYRATLAGKVS